MKNLFVKNRLFLLWLLGCFIILSRRPETLFYAQFWAEDGFVFFHEALKSGWKSFVTPYAGYLHTIPRIITYLAVQSSDLLGQGISWVPTIMNLSTLAISSICAVFVCSSRFNWMGNIYFRMALSSFILAFPNAYEILGNLTNLHWWLGILEFFLLWNILRRKKIPNWLDTAILCAIILTTPNGLIIFPAIALCYFLIHKIKPSKDLFKVSVIFSASAIQLLLMLSFRAPKDIDLMILLNNCIDFVFLQLFANLLIGSTLGYAGMLIAGILFFIILIYFSRKSFKELYIPFSFLFILIALTVFGSDIQSFQYRRYIFIPTVVIASILIYVFKDQLQRKNNRFKLVITALFCLLFLLVSVRIVRQYKLHPLIKYPWKTEADLFDPQGDVLLSFPTNPTYWSVGISSSCDRKEYLPESLVKIPSDSCRKQTFTGSHPSILYRLPKISPVSYCYMDFDYSFPAKAMQMVFISESGKEFPMIFHVEKKNLIQMNEAIQAQRIKFIRIDFFQPLPNVPAQDSNFASGIRDVHFYVSSTCSE